jgi:hypothetical protein
MSTTVKGITARKQHRCDESSWTGLHFIAPGHRYLRHVAFPDDDVNGSDQPWVLRQCVACVGERDDTATTLTAGACAMWCCGDVPCARPLRHDGDHSCRRCATSGGVR